MRDTIQPVRRVHMRDAKWQTIDERARFQEAASEVAAWCVVLVCIAFGVGCYWGWLLG